MKKLLKKISCLILALLIALQAVPMIAMADEEGIAVDASAEEIAINNYFDLETDLDKETSYYNVIFDDPYEEFTKYINIEKEGVLLISIAAGDSSSYYSFKISVSSDSSFKNTLGTIYLFDDEEGKNKTFKIDKAGKYYVKFEVTKRYDASGEIIFPVAFNFIPAGTRNVEVGQEYIAFQESGYGDIYYKVTVNKAGLLTAVITPDAASGYVYFTLLDKNKKELSKEEYVYHKDGKYEYSYAVAKGTYYVKVKTSTGGYLIGFEAKAITDKGGASKSKATAIKVGGSAVNGICLATDKTSVVDWYKFNLSSSKNVKITIDYIADGKVTFEILDSKGKTLIGGTRRTYSGKGTIELESSGKFSKGTYYIKVYKEKGNEKSSAYYSIKVK